MIKKTNIKEIEKEFIINNLSKYQKELIEIKFYVFNRFNELQKKKVNKEDISYMIAEDLGLQPSTIHQMYYRMLRKIILSIKK